MNREIYNNLEKMLKMENKSETTFERYAKAIREMELYFKEKSLKRLSDEEIFEYAYYLHEKTKSTRTYNSKIAAIRYVYRKVIRRVVLDSYLPLKRNNKIEPKIIPNEREMQEILTKCNDLELMCIMLLASGSGLRRNEIATLKVENIKKGKNIIVVTGKGQRERITIIDDKTIEYLRKYYVKEREEDNEYIFSRRNYKGHIRADEITRRIKEYLRNLGMDYTLHDFRKVFATILYILKVDVITIKRYLGHDSIETTMKYINIEKYGQKKEVSPVNEILSKTSNQNGSLICN